MKGKKISDKDSLELKGEWRGWKLGATGFYGAAVLCAVTIFGSLIWLEPLTKANHFVAVVFAVFVGGVYLGFAVQKGRVDDAHAEVIYHRKEVKRIAEEKNKLVDKLVLADRRSSRKNRKG